MMTMSPKVPAHVSTFVFAVLLLAALAPPVAATRIAHHVVDELRQHAAPPLTRDEARLMQNEERTAPAANLGDGPDLFEAAEWKGHWQFSYFSDQKTAVEITEGPEFKHNGALNANMGKTKGGYFFETFAINRRDPAASLRIKLEPRVQSSVFARGWADTKAFYMQVCEGPICYAEVMEWKDAEHHPDDITRTPQGQPFHHGEGPRFEFVDKDGEKMILQKVASIGIDIGKFHATWKVD